MKNKAEQFLHEVNTARDFQIMHSLVELENAGQNLSNLFKPGKKDFENVSKKDLLETVSWVEEHVIKRVQAELDKLKKIA